jgi:UDP-glucose-4-epimerase GalE
MTLVVTGGAGYIGHHVVRLLAAAGHEVIVIDDLSRGEASRVGAPLVRANLGDADAVRPVFRERKVRAILHFAGSIEVGESMKNPAAFWENNVHAARRFFAVAREAGVRRVVFSSTAAVYGEPERTPIPEDHPLRPANPYGETKLAMEEDLRRDFEPTVLRYFNAAGLDEAHRPETHLIPRLVAAIRSRDGTFPVFGRDYPTRDGTCVRDYIHVEDLARAHMLALERPGTFNLGAGRGATVLEVVELASRVVGPIAPRFEPRRPGDVAVLVADITRARRELGWEPRHGLEEILAGAC